MIRRLAICVVLALLAGMPALSAELFYMDHDAFTGKYIGPTGPLVISGDIARGDYERLLFKIADDENRFLSQNKIIVASTAGDVSEALKIAKLVKALHSEVSVGPLTGKCAGACFLIYAAADQRATDGEQLIGISGLDHADPTGGRRPWRRQCANFCAKTKCRIIWPKHCFSMRRAMCIGYPIRTKRISNLERRRFLDTSPPTAPGMTNWSERRPWGSGRSRTCSRCGHAALGSRRPTHARLSPPHAERGTAINLATLHFDQWEPSAFGDIFISGLGTSTLDQQSNAVASLIESWHFVCRAQEKQ
jgi:hypothetical protein